MSRFALAALAALFFAPLASAQEIGIGVGSIGTQALSGTVQGVQSGGQVAGLSAIAGITAAGVASGQTASGSGGALGAASCNGNDCVSAAANTQQNLTQGFSVGGSFSLGGAASAFQGANVGQSIGESIGAGQTQFDYVSLFAQP